MTVRLDVFQSSASYAGEVLDDPGFHRLPKDYVVCGVDYSSDGGVRFWAAGPEFALLVSMVWRLGDEVPRWGAEFVGFDAQGLAVVSVLSSYTIERACAPLEAGMRFAGAPKFWAEVRSYGFEAGAGWLAVLGGELLAL